MNVKRNLFIVLTLSALLYQCASPVFTVEMEPGGTKILKGFFERKDIEQDSLLTWFRINYNAYVPDSVSLRELEPITKDLHFLLVLGTWCGDSKHEVPKSIKIFDALGISERNVKLLGVDRSKNSHDGITDKYNVHRVPTLIVFRGEQELGRIVETPRETQEKDLIKILQK